MKKEYSRQLIHASGVFIIFLGMVLDPVIVILICISIVLFVEAIFRIDKTRKIPLFSPILRISKREDDERGFVYFFVGIIITIYLFKFNIAIANAAIIILLFGDSASTIFGKMFGKTHLPFNERKTYVGTLAFFVVGFVGALTQLPLLPALFGALCGAITEAYSPIDDNIPIPIVSGFAMSLVIYFM
ncbi:MAG: phosphatidate cytidylyltransferase [Methanobacterium sp.]|uniref:diacylglycerol/polyprenol kinase family protein n=1 Tax=Methanobacterium sp. TaxID=2164 RepID=UPI003D656214|nr:phosphatidate cytidylyltransferase [Methanobacterium sp.]